MITENEAEQLAKKAVEQYLNACHCDSQEDAANALMKLCSVSGIVMAMMTGSADAFDRLMGTATFVLQNGPAQPSKGHPLQ